MGKRTRRKLRAHKSPSPNRSERKRRLRRELEAAAQRLIAASKDPSVPAADIAPALLELLGPDSRLDENAFYLARQAPSGRMADVARAMVAASPRSLTALTFAAERGVSASVDGPDGSDGSVERNLALHPRPRGAIPQRGGGDGPRNLSARRRRGAK